MLKINQYFKRESGIITPADKDDERCKYFVQNYDLIAHYVPHIYKEYSRLYVEDCALDKNNISNYVYNPEKEAVLLAKSEKIKEAKPNEIVIPNDYKKYKIPKEKICRFCGKSSPVVTFKKKAHAISELLGNKKLCLRQECDECNALFGTYEDAFGKFIESKRLVSQIKGKNGIPAYSEEGLRIEVGNDKIVIQEKAGENGVTFNENNTISIDFVKQAYRPLDVYKALVVMALSIMPDTECKKFTNTIRWLLDEKVDDRFNHFNYSRHLIFRFIEGTNPLPLQAWVFRRKSGIVAEKDVFDVPYCIYIIEFANYSFQMVVPNIEKDIVLWGKNVKIQSFYSQMDFLDSLKEKRKSSTFLDLSEAEKIKGEKETVTFHYDEKVELKGDLGTVQQLAVNEGVKPIKEDS